MTRSRRAVLPDWPAVAAKLAAELPHTAWHPAAMQFALAHGQHAKRRRRAPPPRWAVAFSGGADSLALLLLLWAEGAGRWGRDFLVLHFNHRLRGRESLADERFCRRVCAALGVPLIVGRWTTAPRQASEAQARAARHEFFGTEMRRAGCGLLWLAHQQDDIAETMLMRLARGSGTAGLAAPRPVQPQADGRVHLRPLLTLSKARLVAALRSAGAKWREDSSNAGDTHLRNRVRSSIVPKLAGVSGRDVLAAAALTRERLQEDDDALEAWLAELAPLERRGAVLDTAKLQGRPRALWRRALHRWLLASGVTTDLSRTGFDELLTRLERGQDTRFSLGVERFAVLRRGKLSLSAR